MNKLLQSEYDAATKVATELYFTTDTHRLYLGTLAISCGDLPSNIGRNTINYYERGECKKWDGTVGSNTVPVYISNGVFLAANGAAGKVGFLNYGAITSLGSSGTFSSNGLAVIDIQFTGRGDAYAYINGKEVMHIHGNGDGIHGGPCAFIVKNGDTWSISSKNYSSHFIPMA